MCPPLSLATRTKRFESGRSCRGDSYGAPTVAADRYSHNMRLKSTAPIAEYAHSVAG